LKNYKELLNQIRCFVFDVDGVLTNGTLLVAADGEFLRMMNIKDGYAIQHAVKNGFQVAVISGGHSSGVPVRMKRLGVNHVYMGVENKQQKLKELLSELNIAPEHTLYMGDDIPDIAAMKLCGLPACPYDAVPEVKQVSRYISAFRGGEGCVRDVIEQVMKLAGKW
jgi:3-deoxy-D-manno-octulosonate 8-phosphate phosphatase (KDO 8-P phosphatase)